MPFLVRPRPRERRRLGLLASEAGQTTAEYALVIIGAAVVAGLLAKWAAGGAISKLFDNVISKILP